MADGVKHARRETGETWCGKRLRGCPVLLPDDSDCPGCLRAFATFLRERARRLDHKARSLDTPRSSPRCRHCKVAIRPAVSGGAGWIGVSGATTTCAARVGLGGHEPTLCACGCEAPGLFWSAGCYWHSADAVPAERGL